MPFHSLTTAMRNVLGACGLAALLMAGSLQASEVGSELPPFALKDAQGNEHTLTEKVQRIYATGGRKSDKLLDAAFDKRDQTNLDQQNAVVIAEISSAPGFVKRIIRSSLKDRSYLTWTDTKGDTKRLLPYRDSQVAVIDLDAFRITQIRHISEAGELQALLDESSTPVPTPTAAPAGQ